MDLTKAIRELYAEKEALDRAIAALEALSGPVISRRRGRSLTTAEDEEEQLAEQKETTERNGDRSPE
jgi:hypothetical protein